MSGLRRVAFVALFGLGGVAILLYLGFWQLDRLVWKSALIAEVESQLSGPPRLATGAETAETDNFAPAAAIGRFVGQRQARFLTSARIEGPGYRIISAFALENGTRILVDRGFAPQAVAEDEPPTPPAGDVSIAGALHWPNEESSFTPDPSLDRGVWFARNVDELAVWLDAEPILFVLSEPPVGAADERWPRPDPVTVDLPNDHLGYAATWFALAAVWAVMTFIAAFRRPR